jgi:ABC-type Fe3+/spermidine/putrescine transport system ATPase subunit
VTHDQEEAFAVGDRVAVARAGNLEQVAEPQAVFHSPATPFVATFVGEADFLTGTADGASAATALGSLPLASSMCGPVDVMLRPHEVAFSSDDGGANAVVQRTEFRGATVLHVLELDSGGTLRSTQPHTRAAGVGERVRVWADAGHGLAAFPASG